MCKCIDPGPLTPHHHGYTTHTRREKVGKWFIQLCGTTPCMVNGAEEIRATIEKHVGIKEGGACPPHVDRSID